jgi:hypothetical protein
MTIVRIIDRHLDREMYHAVGARLNFERQHPLGLIMHGASEIGGTMKVVQIWDSEEYARHFDEEVLKPALQAVGAPVEAEVTIFDVHHLVTP